MKSKRNCTSTGIEPGLSTTAGGTDRGFSRKTILHLALGALSLVFLGGTVQTCAWAQGGRGGVPRPQGQNPNGLHVYIWAGLKSHGAGQHDYPQFLADWSKVLTEHGAVVNGALHFPSSADLEHTDVLVIYKGDAVFLDAGERATLENYVKRGGGLVSFHDSLCGPDPAWFANFVGGAKKHGEVNYTLDAPIHYTVVDKANPIMKDMTDLTIFDEAFYNMTWAKDPAIHVLANVEIPPTRSAGEHKGEVVPQIWTYEHTVAGGQPARAFVWMQGHTYANFANYQVERTLLRGIAWAAKKPVDELVDYVAPPRPQGRGGAPVAGGAPAR
ncbi:MAG: ThuA domain-containing protein [Acidobacteriota bacterium]